MNSPIIGLKWLTTIALFACAILSCDKTPQKDDYKCVDLSSNGTANCYIANVGGKCKFKAVKGNSNESVGDVASVEVLWETFGTAEEIMAGDLIDNVSYKDGYIFFTLTSPSPGNALIAAKDPSGKILWSWHIWITQQPKDQVYYNNAGTMMDRNLGATSATPGDVEALGLLYQWGRKDPFLGSSSISESTQAASTLTWPASVVSDATIGTIAYAQENPTTFIKYNSSNLDWYYTSYSSTDNTRWQSTKTIYDPCPPGYRVPDGGENGIWSNGLGSPSAFTGKQLYDSTTRGYNLTTKLGDASNIWYPFPGYLNAGSGQLRNVSSSGHCWSVTPKNEQAHYLNMTDSPVLQPSYFGGMRANGLSVRCCKE